MSFKAILAGQPADSAREIPQWKQYELITLDYFYRLSITETPGGLPFLPGLTRVLYQKAYPSPSGNNVKTDISIEVTNPATDSRMMLIIVECKYRRTTIGTAHLNDLSAKLRLLNASKGIIVSNLPFGSSVIKQASFLNIALVHFPVLGEPEWILP